MMILIAGPYRSGTGDDPELMAANLRRLEEAAWPIFRRGHVPMIGEWVALPTWREAGGKTVGDELYEKLFHPTAERLIELCGAVLRLPGASKGGDDDVRKAQARGIPVYYSIDDIPHADLKWPAEDSMRSLMCRCPYPSASADIGHAGNHSPRLAAS